VTQVGQQLLIHQRDKRLSPVLVSVHVAQYLVFREAIALFALLTTPLVSSHSSFSKYVRGEMFHVVVS
jgi:hypothetical protein